MKAFLKHNGVYIAIYIALLTFVGGLLLSYNKIEIHKAINATVGNPLLDTFFKYVTHLGDGLFAILIVLILFFYNTKQALYILLSYLSAGLVSFIMKEYLFHGYYRPYPQFNWYLHEKLQLINGVDILSNNSYPSGHALSAFALFFSLLLMSKNHTLKLCYFLLAVIAAYSRCYLSQHWLVDIFAGSIIGTFFSIIFYSLFYSNSKFNNLNVPLRNLFAKNKQRV